VKEGKRWNLLAGEKYRLAAIYCITTMFKANYEGKKEEKQTDSGPT